MAEYIEKEALVVKIRTEKAEWEKQPVPIDIFEKFNHRVVSKLLQNVIDFIEAQPTADVAPARGEWVYNAHTSNYSCPKCRKIVGVVRENFCPKCGADMRGDSRD